jgi:hypothetical protein
MHKSPVTVPALVLLLAACLLIAGCSSPETTNQTAQPGTTTTTAGGVLYTAGDIVKNPSSSADTAFLVLGYDSASDTYERALIYPNAGGGWGYRTDNRTEKAPRSVMEKVYTENLGNVPPESVPIVTPTIITPVETFQLPANWTEITTTTTTDASHAKPNVERSIPDKGIAGTTVKITQLVGSNFLAGANVTLSRSGYATINAYSVKVESPKSLTCSFDIPASAPAGTYDLTVRNPNGLSGTYTNYFTVNRETTVVITTTSTRQGTLDITYIDPPFTFSGTSPVFTVTGTKFQTNAEVSLRSTVNKPTIKAKLVMVDSETQLHAYFDIPKGSFGSWDFIVKNPDDTYGAWLGGMTIN